MGKSMLKEEIKVYSERYGLHGVVRDYGVVTKLIFTYDDKKIEMGMERKSFDKENLEEAAVGIMESYVCNLASHRKGRKLMLHNWYVGEHQTDSGKYWIAHGVVTGHRHLPDTMYIHTSAVMSVYVDEKEEEFVVTTRNSVYHCPLAYCRYEQQDHYRNIIPDYSKLKKKYRNAAHYPSIEPGKVLLVLADYCNYYFHSLYYVPAGSKKNKPLEYLGRPHVGMIQDSFLINTERDEIDLRYFPHYQNIEFYSEETEGCPWYIENFGETVLYAKTSAGLLRLEPGERKEVVEENAEKEEPPLPGGDLYPAQIIE